MGRQGFVVAGAIIQLAATLTSDRLFLIAVPVLLCHSSGPKLRALAQRRP